MASLADKVLPQEAQDKIANITAQAQSGAISWADANKQANEVRANAGANYTVGSTGTTTYNDGSTISSYASGSVASNGAAKDYLDNWNNNANVSNNYANYLVAGIPTQGQTAIDTISRMPEYANQTVKIGNYSVTFNQSGQPIRLANDGGASATSTIKTTHANDSAYHQAAYQAAQADNWDLVGMYLNKIGETYGQQSNGAINMQSANLYGQELQNEFLYDANDYYNKLYDKVYGEGSAATFDATGGAIKTYATLVEALGGADKAQQMIAPYMTSTTTSSAMNTLPGLYLSTGLAGGHNDMTDFLKDMFAQNLEAELNALKTAHDNNVAELESRNDMIAEQFRAARNQAAAKNALEVQGMNERALATGLNTGTSGQLALSQSMAYQNNLGNLWAQEAQQQAESDRLMAEFLRDYNASVNQATATNNAMLQEAIYKELIRQEEMAAAAEAQRIKQEQADREWLYMLEQADREWLYMLEQDELDRQLQYAQLAAKNNSGGEKTTKLTYNQVMDAIDRGNITPGVMAAYEAIMGVPYGQGVQPGMTEDAIAKAAAEFRKKSPKVHLDDRTLDYWLHDNGYSNEAAQLFKAYLEEYGATYSRR